MEPSCAAGVADIKPDPAALFQLNYDEADTYMPSPFCSAELQGPVIQQDSSAAPPSNKVGQTAIPTPPPERTYHSPDSTHSHGSCISPQHSASATSDSYIKGSSLEESPVSSPNSSYTGEVDSPEMQDCDTIPKLIKKERESCIRNTNPQSITDEQSTKPEEGETSSSATTAPREQNVPKNIKLPQRKGGMQLWQFLYALLNDPDRRYRKLIEWTANSLSREFRLLEPEAIAIWWGEHKNKKNMSYDKLSRSLRYYYDKGIIRKISGERYVYQFCIDPELMYKHIGNSDSRPKLKPMPSSAYHATSEYQNEHGFAAAALMNKDSCFVAQGPMSLGLTHGHFGPRPVYPPPPSYNSGISPFLSHGYADFTTDFHSHLGAYNSVFFPPTGYDAVSAVPHVSASLGYAQMEPPLPLKAHLPPLIKNQSYEMPNLTAVTQLKYENEHSYGKPLSNAILNPTTQLKYETDSFCGKSPMLRSNSSSQNAVLSSHALSPPPLTSNRVSSPVTPSFTSHGSPLSQSYSNHSSPHTYSGHGTDPLGGFDDLMPFSSTDDYSSNTMTYHLAFSKGNSTHSQVTSTTLAAPWE